MQINPVIVKELRGRMRGWRSLIVLVLYLAVLSVVMLMIYSSARNVGRSYGAPASAEVGRTLFYGLAIIQTVMVGLLTPAFTSSAITQEREQKTFELLVTTLLTSRSIILGKLGAALAYVALLIIAVAPLESLAFMFGGVSPEEIILSQVVMLAAALLFASIGIFWSSVVRTSVASSVLSYGTILFLMLGVPLILVSVATSMNTARYYSTGISPVDTVQFWYVAGAILSLNPLVAMGMSEGFYQRGQSLFVYVTDDLPISSIRGESMLIVSPWLVFCMEAVALSALLVFLSIRRVQPVRYKSALSAPAEPPPHSQAASQE